MIENEAPVTEAREEPTERATSVIEDLNAIDRVLQLEPSPPRIKHTLRPRHKWVVVRPLRRGDRQTEGGIVLPGSSVHAQYGEVVSVSPDVTDLKPGMKVVFTNFPQDLDAIEDLTLDRNLQLIRDEEVYAEAIPVEEVPASLIKE
jgi:co-chaperonin GroES (HSP10)